MNKLSAAEVKCLHDTLIERARYFERTAQNTDGEHTENYCTRARGQASGLRIAAELLSFMTLPD